MAVPRPEPRDDETTPSSEIDPDVVGSIDAPLASAALFLDIQSDTETIHVESPNDRAGWHVRLFGSPEFFRLWLVQVVSATGDWLGFSAIILLAARIGGGAGAGAISLVMAARIVPGFFFGPLGSQEGDGQL
jgi:hypothetical protein